jgi:hypothetical protein
MAAKFQPGDFVRTIPVENVTQYTGRIVEVTAVRFGFTYKIELVGTGLIRTFFESQLELIEKSLRDN